MNFSIISSKNNYCAKVTDEKKIIYRQLRYGHLIIEKKNTCPNRTKKIHNLLFGAGESKIKEKKLFLL